MPTQNEPLNTAPIQQFIQSVKSADAGRQREIKMDIQQAKNLAFTLGLVMTRLNGNLEEIIAKQANNEDEIINIQVGSTKSNW